jgi:hypothetical protein
MATAGFAFDERLVLIRRARMSCPGRLTTTPIRFTIPGGKPPRCCLFFCVPLKMQGEKKSDLRNIAQTIS